MVTRFSKYTSICSELMYDGIIVKSGRARGGKICLSCKPILWQKLNIFYLIYC